MAKKLTATVHHGREAGVKLRHYALEPGGGPCATDSETSIDLLDPLYDIA